MVELAIVGVVGIVLGFIGGVLVYRNNVKLFERKIASLESGFERVNVELAEAYQEVEELKAKLSRKPKK